MSNAEQPNPDSTSTAVEAPRTPAIRWRVNMLLFAITLFSVFYRGFEGNPGLPLRERLVQAAAFAGALLGILLVHEFGHYFAARYHRVEASLPYFLPLPLLSPFGTMGAVIRMSGKIRTRNALLDIGASGPLAGLCIAIPLYAWSVRHSVIVPIDLEGSVQLGNSIALRILDGLFAPKVVPGMDIQLPSAAYGAWGGLFITMLNLLPLGQLDGGHVAYALFGKRQDLYARWLHRVLLLVFFFSLVVRLVLDRKSGFAHFGRHLNASLFWLFWFEMLAILGSFTGNSAVTLVGGKSRKPMPPMHRIVATLGLMIVAATGRDTSRPFYWVCWCLALCVLLAMERRGGVLREHALLEHPPTDVSDLSPLRKVVAVLTLLFFILLFMPTPMST
jgi:membrane-associated protease RseP (regulator of RpoE activity)